MEIVIAVAAVISVGLIVAAVLIGIHISTEAQKDIVQVLKHVCYRLNVNT